MILEIQRLKSNSTWNKNDCQDIKFNYNYRFNNYIQATELIDDLKEESNENFCSYLELSIKERIGSESQFGEVYNNTIDNSVIKLLPLINDNSYDMNEKELNIAVQASQLVLEGTSPHFPIVYDFGFCKDFTGFKYKNVSSHFLISEKASCDLYTYLKQNRPKNEMQNIRKQCIKAISDMHKYLKICHNDLHLRNFLVMKNRNDILILIHDFGKAEYRENYQELDYEFFENEFKEID